MAFCQPKITLGKKVVKLHWGVGGSWPKLEGGLLLGGADEPGDEPIETEVEQGPISKGRAGSEPSTTRNEGVYVPSWLYVQLWEDWVSSANSESELKSVPLQSHWDSLEPGKLSMVDWSKDELSEMVVVNGAEVDVLGLAGFRWQEDPGGIAVTETDDVGEIPAELEQ